MKKIFLAFILLLCLVGCKETSPNFNNQLPMRRVAVSMKYEDTNRKASLFCSIDLQEKDFYSKRNHKKLKTLIGGDEIEVYYTNDDYQSIDHILVEEASQLVVEATNEVIPGSNKMDLFVPDSDEISLRYIDIKYIIHKDGSYEDLKTAKTGQKLYATYQEKDIEKTSENHYVYKILALYSYNPRS